jgi:23S rRNA pseudouridine2605 synthase
MTMALMRLQKFLSAAGVCSRRQGEKHIRAGEVRVNAEVVTQLGTRIDPTVDRVEFKGQPVEYGSQLLYILLHKPKGVVTSCRHPGKKTVVDLIDIQERIYPVGRLDKDSTGLLLMTNDGRIHHGLLHPSFDHEKEYAVTVAEPISEEALARMRKGVVILEKRTRKARIRRLSPTRFRITLKEGRNRQIRRMVKEVGNRVVDLERVRMGHLKLGGLPNGKWRYLTEKEQKTLLTAIQIETGP